VTEQIALPASHPRPFESLVRAIAGKTRTRGSPRSAAGSQRRSSISCKCARSGKSAVRRRPRAQVRDAFSELIARLAPLDTYEQRALARRRSAIREFDSLQTDA